MKPALLLFLLAPAVLQLAGCATVPGDASPVIESTQTDCASGNIRLDDDFSGGNAGSCLRGAKGEFTLAIAPEDAPPINCSPWYAFRLTPTTGAEVQQVTVKLDYEHCGHRYRPKISSDGVNWSNLPAEAVTITERDGVKQAQLRISLAAAPLYVAGQELLPPAAYDQWLQRQAKHPDVTTDLLGLSAEKRSIRKMTVKAKGSMPREQVVLIGRQHPPEVTGALAMLPFAETLLEDTPLARQYRERFETIVVPLMNPDGVEHGHWRHNTGGTDLNRDWGPFAQPETKLMLGLLQQIADDPEKQLRFFSDFHSTKYDVFYTIPDDNPTNPALFTRDWLARLQTRMPDYAVNRDQNHDAAAHVSKAYVYEKYGVPSVTFELGDETDRALITRIGREAAIAMMETLLATTPPPGP